MDSITIIRLYKDDLLPAEPVTSYLELDSKAVVPLNFAIGDIRDISKKKGTFSKSIKVPATKNNNKVLNNYYDVNIKAGLFDINKLQKCAIIQDGIVILDNAILQLVSIDKTQDDSSYEDSVSYTMLVKDSTSDFFSNINNKYLTDINLSEYNHTYRALNVVASWDNTTGYKYILPYNGTATGNAETNANDATYELNEMLPAVYAKTYWDRIFGGAGYTYEWDATSSSYMKFKKLLIPYNGDAIVSAREIVPEYEVRATRYITGSGGYSFVDSLPVSDRYIPWTRTPSGPINVMFNQEDYDPSNSYNISNNAPYFVPYFPGPTNNIKITVELYSTITKTGGTTAFTTNMENTIRIMAILPTSNTASVLATNTDMSISMTFPVSGPMTIRDGITTMVFTIPTSSLPGATRLYVDAINNITGGPVTGHTSLNLTWNILGGSIKYDVELDGTLGYNVPFKMNKVIPQKIKQSDFIKGLLTMFNLYVIVDKEVSNKLTIISRDDYYDNGNIKNWTSKLVKNKAQELKFLPEISNKKAVLTYKADSDLVNTKYLANSNEVYGQVEYIFDNEYVKDTTKTELLFSPTPMTNTVFGAICSVLNGAAPKTNIRVLYDGGNYSCNQYIIRDYITATNTDYLSLTKYPLTIHWDKPTNPTFDLNFLPCDYYYRSDDWGSNTNNNLFNLYWRRTLNQINEGKLLTAYFDLNAYDINQMLLNDKIRIDNSWWNINAIKDYDANSKSPTKVELISIDSLLKVGFNGTSSTTTTTTAAPTTTTTTASSGGSSMGNLTTTTIAPSSTSTTTTGPIIVDPGTTTTTTTTAAPTTTTAAPTTTTTAAPTTTTAAPSCAQFRITNNNSYTGSYQYTSCSGVITTSQVVRNGWNTVCALTGSFVISVGPLTITNQGACLPCYSYVFGPAITQTTIQWTNCDGTFGSQALTTGQYFTIPCMKEGTGTGGGQFTKGSAC